MHFLRLLVLLPALCLGLLGQGHSWVLCEMPCGSVQLEAGGACNCADACARETDRHFYSSSNDAVEVCACVNASAPCRDTVLDPGYYISDKAPQLPNLDLFAVGCLIPTPYIPVMYAKAPSLIYLARGPPGQWRSSPPQVLACMRTVVMVV